jgi:hypothetical protein
MDLIMHRLRHFGCFVLGLYLMALAGGVLPLEFDHTFHVFEGQGAASEAPEAHDQHAQSAHDHAAPGRHGDHRHGLIDLTDECCFMHHLTGVTHAPSGATSMTVVASARMPAVSAHGLIDTDPPRLDRPPKA